jgi:hypothetical protein
MERKFRGERGETGAQGERGATGATGAAGPKLPRNVAYAVVFLFVLSLVLNGANLKFTSDQANSVRHQFAVSNAQGKREGELIEDKLCGSFGKLATLKPPAGNPATNPSRAYLQGEHAILDEIGTDIRCPR